MNAIHFILLSLVAFGLVAIWYFRQRPEYYQAYWRNLVFSLISIAVLLPFIWIVAGAFKDKSVINTYLLFPPISKWSWESMNLENFKVLFTPIQQQGKTVYFWHYMLNSMFLACTITLVQLLTSSLAGFALAFYKFKGKEFLFSFMVTTMMIPALILFAPLYGLLHRLGWMDSYNALIFPAAINVFGIVLFRQSMMGLSKELLEAARIDGCSEFRIYYRIILPLMRPISAAFSLVAFLTAWGNFLGPNIFIQSREKLPLPVILNMYVGQFSEQYGVFLAGTLLAVIPPAILFLALQKEFVQGLTSGAVKG
jgi:ABC-type glycerol-3-phosphate transport system permease component